MIGLHILGCAATKKGKVGQDVAFGSPLRALQPEGGNACSSGALGCITSRLVANAKNSLQDGAHASGPDANMGLHKKLIIEGVPLGVTAEEGEVGQDAAYGGPLEAVPHARPAAVDEVLRGNGYKLLIDLYHQAACPAPPRHLIPGAEA